MNILIIKDNRPGHFNQSEGIAMMLTEVDSNIEISRIEIEPKSKTLRRFFRIILQNFYFIFRNKKNMLSILNWFYSKYTIPTIEPDLIISTGRETCEFNVFMSLIYNSKNIFNGKPSISSKLFTNVISVLPLGYSNQISLQIGPSMITPGSIHKEAKKFIIDKNLDEKQSYYALFIGGDTEGYTYDRNFFENLITFLTSIALKDKIKWLITSSRRTNPVYIDYLQSKVLNETAYFVAYHNVPEKTTLPFLGLAKKIFVTEDSGSMMSESIASQKPVYTIYHDKIKPNRIHQKVLKLFSEKKYIQRINVSNKIENLNINFIPYDKTIDLEMLKVVSK